MLVSPFIFIYFFVKIAKKKIDYLNKIDYTIEYTFFNVELYKKRTNTGAFMRYSTDIMDKVNSFLKIEEVVGEFVQLKKSGANYKGLCPFHSDTSPSFIVSPSKNICKCFVCGAGGNPVTFYSNYKKISFNEALKELSEKYNLPINLKNFEKKNDTEKNIYYEIMEKAQNFFSEELFKNTGREGLEYLVNRGILPEDIYKLGLGYAPNSRNGLLEYLLNKGYEFSKIQELGLCKEGDNGEYDSFRNRIIFPIYSLDKKVIAFGGRTLELGKEIPKYINSPDTPIFKKGNILYGLGEKYLNIKKKKYAILMEGYMDVIMAELNGFDVTLAPLGTALTDGQSEILKRYTDNVILSFDMDAPGQKATEKAIIMLKKYGFSIRVLEFKGAKDPDEYIKKYGKNEFLNVIKNSLEGFEFLYNFYAKEHDLNDLFSKQNFIKRFKEFFQGVSDKLEQSMYINKLSVNTGVEKEILWDALIEKNKFNKKRIEKINFEETTEKKTEEECKIELLAMSLILYDNKYYEYFKGKEIETPLVKKVFNYFDKYIGMKNEITFKLLLQEGEFTEDDKKDILRESLVNYNRCSSDVEKRGLFLELLSEWLRKEIIQCKKQSKNIVFMVELKRLEQRLSRQCSIEDLKNMDEELKNKMKFFGIIGGVL